MGALIAVNYIRKNDSLPVLLESLSPSERKSIGLHLNITALKTIGYTADQVQYQKVVNQLQDS